uniref:Uncharacterized protein n=1 Tax=Nymphaea colorata TaxID=210225 RepID=A0A5K1AF97_9MAGN
MVSRGKGVPQAGEVCEVGSAEEGGSGPRRQPSSMNTTSAIDGRSSGSGAVHSSPTLIPSRNSSHSEDSGSTSSRPGSSSSEIWPLCSCRFTHFTMSSSCVNVTGLRPVSSSSSTIPKLYASASLVARPVTAASGATYPSDPTGVDEVDAASADVGAVSFSSPKSERWASKSASKRTFWGLTSPWTMDAAWRKASPRATPRAIRWRMGQLRMWPS